jgi:hypothetical protein
MTLSGTVIIAMVLLISATYRASAIDPPSVVASPSSFTSGATVSVTGSGFAPGATLMVWLDINGNGQLDNGEPSVETSASSAGDFAVLLNVGAVPVGSYSIDAGQRHGNGADYNASTPVTVFDSSTLGAISSAVASLGADIGNVQTNLAGSVSTAVGGIQSSVSSLQSDIDTKLGKILSTDSQVLSYLQGGVPQEYHGSGLCVLSSANPDAGCDTSLGGDAGQIPFGTDSMVTLTVWIASCSGTPPCQPNQLEAGGSVAVTLTNGHAETDTFQPLYYCNYGTCSGQDIKTLTFSTANFKIHGGCDKGSYGTNSCSDNIEVFYSYSALESP